MREAAQIALSVTHSAGCVSQMDEWDRGLYTAAELLEMGACNCDRDVRIAAAGMQNGLSAFEREVLAQGYIKISGKSVHASDCATSCAPAMVPGPCDCSARQPNATEREAEDAIKVLERAIEAASNSNQAGENAVVRAASAITPTIHAAGTGERGER